MTSAMAEPTSEFRLDVPGTNFLREREQRRARQEAYRRELSSQIADTEARREMHARKIRELEERHELQSATYNPWGKPGSGAPLRQADGALVTNVKAYHRAKQRGLIAQDLSPNEIGDNEQPFGYTLTTKSTPEDRSPLRTSRSAACAPTGRVGEQGPRSMDAVTVSLSPPRNRYRFDRLPPEEQSYLDRRMKERQELEAALLSQVEEKRAKRELERAAKQAEDEEERARVLRVLAEERAANRHRVRDKNLRAGEAPPALSSGSGGAGDHGWPSPQRQRHRNEQQADTTPQRQRRNSRFGEASYAARPRGGLNGGDRATRLSGGGGWMVDGAAGGAGRAAGPEAAMGSEADRNRVLLILRRLEDHGRMLDRLASELAVVKSAQQPSPDQQVVGAREVSAVQKAASSVASLPSPGLSGETFQPFSAIANSSSLSPLFRTFQDDEDQLDRLLQRFERQDL
ncbi:unnamed protein product [Ectocarpus sp. 12 AP-2014]